MFKNEKTKKTVSIVVFALVAGSIVSFFAYKAFSAFSESICKKTLESQGYMIAKQEKRGRNVVNVEVQLTKFSTLKRRIRAIGKLKAQEYVKIKSEMNGRVKLINFVEGAPVKKGQVIIQFDADDRIAEVKLRQASLDATKAEFERQKLMRGKGVGRAQEYDKILGEYKQADGGLDRAKAELAKATIYAPFDGIIGIIDVSVGAYIEAGKDLVSLVDLSNMKVDFKVPESHILSVGVGQIAEVTVGAFKDQKFIATVDAIDPAIESESRSFLVKASIPNQDNLLKPGLFANVQLITAEIGDAIMISDSAIERQGEFDFVWIIEKGRAVNRRILTGTREDGKVEIINGLKPGELVVVSGQIRLQEGIRVNIVNADDIKKEEISEGTETQETNEEESS